MFNRLILTLLSFGAITAATAVAPGEIRFHNETSDTTRITELLKAGTAAGLQTPNERVAWFAEQFLDTPYVGHTLEGDPEMLTVNLDELDCTTFVETVMALAETVGENRSSWRDFVYNLERIRYRGGHMNGYPSRLHYNSDWVVDNSHRGVITDVTNRFPRFNYIVKTLDFMSSHADKYAALANSANLAGIKSMELGYRSHRFPYIKALDMDNKAVKAAFRTGDIVALTANIPNLDTYHMGIIVVRDGEPYLLHASSSAGKVVLNTIPMAAFFKRNRHMTGLRVFRLNEN